MKSQMKFQKILTLITLILGAIGIFYALIFFSGGINIRREFKDNNFIYTHKTGAGIFTEEINIELGGENFYNAAQAFNNALFTISIIYLLATVTLYVTASNKRRNYYITNYVSIILVAVCAFALFIFVYAELSILLNSFKTDILWDNVLKAHELSLNKDTGVYEFGYDRSTATIIIGYILYAFYLVNAALLVFNLVWKIKLMQGEKKLLANGYSKEVA